MVSYDWPLTAQPQEILVRLRRIAAQLGTTALPVMALAHGKKKARATDLFKIEDFSTIQSIGTAGTQVSSGALADISYSDNKKLGMAVLCIAVRTNHAKTSVVVDMIHALHEANCIGYSIAFDAPLSEKAMYYAFGITYGEVKTHYDELCADELGRFFFQRTRKNRSDRAYNRDKIRGIYPVNALNSLQKRVLCDEAGINESRFEALDEDRHLLVLSDEDVSSLRERLVGSAFLI